MTYILVKESLVYGDKIIVTQGPLKGYIGKFRTYGHSVLIDKTNITTYSRFSRESISEGDILYYFAFISVYNPCNVNTRHSRRRVPGTYVRKLQIEDLKEIITNVTTNLSPLVSELSPDTSNEQIKDAAPLQ